MEFLCGEMGLGIIGLHIRSVHLIGWLSSSSARLFGVAKVWMGILNVYMEYKLSVGVKSAESLKLVVCNPLIILHLHFEIRTPFFSTK